MTFFIFDFISRSSLFLFRACRQLKLCGSCCYHQTSHVSEAGSLKQIAAIFSELLPSSNHCRYVRLFLFSKSHRFSYRFSTLTDGRVWIYAAYQPNTVYLTNNQPGSRSHNNVLWLDKDRALYTKVEDSKLLGLPAPSLQFT